MRARRRFSSALSVGPLLALVSLGWVVACSSSSEGTGGEGGRKSSTSTSTADASGPSATASTGLGPPDLPPGDPPSHGGTITFESIGSPGWYPSRRDPAIGPCDAYQSDDCCLAHYDISSDALTPWDEDLIMTLRGPMQVKQLAVYQPDGGSWGLVSGWDATTAATPSGMAFDGNHTESDGFDGSVGTECLVNVSTSNAFACGPGSEPYCPPPNGDHVPRSGWAGSKMFVMLATMPRAGDVPNPCSDNDGGNWYDAPWIGLSVGELVRAGSFVSCHCYAKDPNNAAVADGCGQFNVFEVVNDNNSYKNLDVFSTNMIGYGGYVGEGPCGGACDASTLGGDVDLIDKASNTEAAEGAVANPDMGPHAAFRRPEDGYRYFIILLDVPSRTVQLAIVHPDAIPSSVGGLLPGLPGSVDQTTIDAVRSLRLPQ